MKRWRRPPLQHPLAPAFARAVESLSIALSPATERNYNIAVRSFLVYLGAEYPKITGLEQLRRDPHALGWMSRMRAQTPSLATATCIGRLIALRAVLNELAWTHKLAELAHMIRREDIPRTPQSLPRPLTAEQDQFLQQELMRRNDLAANVFLLLRHTGMRIGECVDLSYDCLHTISPNQWAIHVPLGKLKTERMVPVDAFVRDLVHRLRFFRSLDPLPNNGRLLAWHGSRVSLLARLRDYLHLACHSASLPTSIATLQNMSRMSPFQSTPPAWGATGVADLVADGALVSIHAPRVGGDPSNLSMAKMSKCFNPRPPRGGRLRHNSVLPRCPSFNPRPPRGGRLSELLASRTASPVSIHAPRVGGDH